MNAYYYIIATLCLTLLQVASANAQHQTAQAPSVPQIQPEELTKLKTDADVVILDARSPKEYQKGHLKNARFVNYDTFTLQDVADISKDQKIVVYCKKGGRSNDVANQLIKAGYKRVKSLEGGITRWKEEGYQTTNE